MLVGEEKVTLLHKTYDPNTRLDRWEPAVYQNASWYGKQAATVGDSGLNTADEYTVRIFTGELIPAAVGDLLIRGEFTDSFTGTAQLAGWEFCTVTGVRDNRRGLSSIFHWRLDGK